MHSTSNLLYNPSWIPSMEFGWVRYGWKSLIIYTRSYTSTMLVLCQYTWFEVVSVYRDSICLLYWVLSWYWYGTIHLISAANLGWNSNEFSYRKLPMNLLINTIWPSYSLYEATTNLCYFLCYISYNFLLGKVVSQVRSLVGMKNLCFLVL